MTKFILRKRGFTLIETLISLAILVIICSIGLWYFRSVKEKTELNSLTKILVSKLEQAKTNAMSGMYGTNSGINFSSSSYTYFIGTSFDPSTTTNERYNIASGYELSTSLPSSQTSIIFSRLSGEPQANATVTISNLNDPSKKKEIYIGNMGDINVVK